VDTLYTIGLRKVSGLNGFKNFLKSDHWLRKYCILSGGVSYFEPCTLLISFTVHFRTVICDKCQWPFAIMLQISSRRPTSNGLHAVCTTLAKASVAPVVRGERHNSQFFRSQVRLTSS